MSFWGSSQFWDLSTFSSAQNVLNMYWWSYAAGLHEDIEHMERVIVKDLKREMKTHKEKLMQSHRVKRRLDTIQEAARKLVCCCMVLHGGQGAWRMARYFTRLESVLLCWLRQ